jgi:hypothetical protein
MGRWTNADLSSAWISMNWDRDNVVKVVHMADYCASRKVDAKMDELDKWEFPEEIK